MSSPPPGFSHYVTEPNDQTRKNKEACAKKTEPAPHTVRTGDGLRCSVTVAIGGVQSTVSLEINLSDPNTWPYHGPSGRIWPDFDDYSELNYAIQKRATEATRNAMAAKYGRF